MSIVMNLEKCKGCGKCAEVCPGSLIQIGFDHKADMKYPKDCWGCSSCIKECQYGAIAFYLGADIGGMGSRMSVTTDGDTLEWKIEKADGDSETIFINKKESNQY